MVFIFGKTARHDISENAPKAPWKAIFPARDISLILFILFTNYFKNSLFQKLDYAIVIQIQMTYKVSLIAKQHNFTSIIWALSGQKT